MLFRPWLLTALVLPGTIYPSSCSAFLLIPPIKHTTSNRPDEDARKIRLLAQVDKGFNLLEIASRVVPQGKIVQTAKESWKFIWKVCVFFLF